MHFQWKRWRIIPHPPSVKEYVLKLMQTQQGLAVGIIHISFLSSKVTAFLVHLIFHKLKSYCTNRHSSHLIRLTHDSPVSDLNAQWFSSPFSMDHNDAPSVLCITAHWYFSSFKGALWNLYTCHAGNRVVSQLQFLGWCYLLLLSVSRVERGTETRRSENVHKVTSFGLL